MTPQEIEYLHSAYNATSTDDGKGEIETYQYWLERQLTSRMKAIKTNDQEIARLRAERQVFKQSVQDSYKTLLNTLGV